MNILIMMDSFKGSISSKELGEFIQQCLKEEGLNSISIPISDGGEGFLDMIDHRRQSVRVHVNIKDVNGTPLSTYYLKEDKVAYVELAKVCGYKPPKERRTSILDRSTYALGIVIQHAIDNGCNQFIVGLGGSGTNDGGMGMLEALGFQFFDADGNLIQNITPRNFFQVSRIENCKEIKDKNIQLTVVCDVRNVLLGPSGATYTYGLQKGASTQELELLEQGLIHMVSLATKEHKRFEEMPGSGAAGGTAYAFLAYLGASNIYGIDFIKKHLNPLESEVDLLITGEGRIDQTSRNGKVVFELIDHIKAKQNVIICGLNALEEELPNAKIFAIVPEYATLEESLTKPKQYLNQVLDLIRKL